MQQDLPDLVRFYLGVFLFLMKGISLNFNGLGCDKKKSWINGLIDSESPNFLEFKKQASAGASGGILTMWDSRVFSMEFKISERNFLAVLGSWSGISSKVGLLNIYAPQASLLKDQLWSSIETIMNEYDVIWILFRDYNFVRHRGERVGSSFDAGEANTFNDFISHTGLFDFPFNGRRFTRFDSGGLKARKLDRFLVSNCFLNIWVDASVSVLCRSYSDHCPIMLTVESHNFRLKPYRIFDKWIGNRDLLPLISTSWALNPSLLPPDLFFKNKIKKLRSDIKAWAMNKISAQNEVRDVLSRRLLDWDIKAEAGLINNDDGVHVNGVWRDDPEEIKHSDAYYFSYRFKEPLTSRPTFNSPLFRKISECDACFLESIITEKEIKEAIWGCAGSKAPGPDGFNFNFIKAYWDILKDDFVGCIKHFETSGKIANGCNPSFIVLILKISIPLGFSDYRPISLFGCAYKDLSKILANCLAMVIASVTCPNQSTFIVGRQILDGCLVANEIVIMASIEKSKLLLFKVDFKKAFDSVNWTFLQNIIRQMGFGTKWRSWIHSCLSSASISVLVNGSCNTPKMGHIGIRV
uniref:Transposon TX1 uncharacterized n=1 Tax=Tanacetum cinerariifolium TaxID=118510 RepID=A0A699GJT9_TANCI|nr:transposon TX1 uncharacterized [Tanacetum cinerariifolium]